MSVERGWVVVAWMERGMEFSGEAFRADLGERPKMVERLTAKSLIWKRDGDAKDCAEAGMRVSLDLGRKVSVFHFDGSEKDPLGRAKGLLFGA